MIKTLLTTAIFSLALMPLTVLPQNQGKPKQTAIYKPVLTDAPKGLVMDAPKRNNPNGFGTLNNRFEPVANFSAHEGSAPRFIFFKPLYITNLQHTLDGFSAIQSPQHNSANHVLNVPLINYAFRMNKFEGLNTSSPLTKSAKTNIIDTISVFNPALSVKIFPNPATDQIEFDFQQVISQKAEVVIYNMLGESVLRFQVATGESRINTSISQLKGGSYIAKIDCGRQHLSYKFIVSH